MFIIHIVTRAHCHWLWRLVCDMSEPKSRDQTHTSRIISWAPVHLADHAADTGHQWQHHQHLQMTSIGYNKIEKNTKTKGNTNPCFLIINHNPALLFCDCLYSLLPYDKCANFRLFFRGTSQIVNKSLLDPLLALPSEAAEEVAIVFRRRSYWWERLVLLFSPAVISPGVSVN